DAQVAATENMISKMSLASGIADDDLRPALASLVRGTKDIGKAQEGLSLAMDISTATGKDLATVSDALSKAYAGNMKGLKALSPEMAALIKDGADLNTIMDVLGGTFGGATAEAAGTAEGQMKRFGIAIAEAKENIGAALIPVVEKALPLLTGLGAWAQENTTTFLVIAGLIGGIAAAIVAVNIALKVYNAIQVITNALTAVWNALLLANPITLVVLAVVALIAILTALYFKFDGVRKIVDTVFDAITTGVKFSFDAIKTYFTAVLNIYKSVFNGIASLWNNTIGKLSFTFPSWVPGLGGKGFSVPNIPLLAEGGIVTGPTLAMIGEAGPEAVVPLSKMGGMGGVTVNVNGGLATSAEIGQAVVNAIRAYNRSAGPANIQVA
ncbi:MAG TPA: hypothetical protein VLA24_13895, partial [Pseudomonadales bacterium]|nr:hypothetical protein [Pseudomonadales bacterium]